MAVLGFQSPYVLQGFGKESLVFRAVGIEGFVVKGCLKGLPFF